jgi:hypothetical protein
VVKLKVIIAGGRDYQVTLEDWQKLNEIPITEVVSGGASGADKGGEQYAEDKQIPVRKFPADWKEHGRAAGPIRNREMAQYADAVVLFRGGIGTNSMKAEAEKAGIAIYDFRG